MYDGELSHLGKELPLNVFFKILLYPLDPFFVSFAVLCKWNCYIVLSAYGQIFPSVYGTARAANLT